MLKGIHSFSHPVGAWAIRAQDRDVGRLVPLRVMVRAPARFMQAVGAVQGRAA